MATLKIDILKHHQRRDGTYNVKILLTHQRKKAHIATTIYVSKEQITKKFDLKDPFLKDELNLKIKKYREIINGMDLIDNYTVKELSLFIQQKSARGKTGIDFIAFSKGHIEKLAAAGRNKTAARMLTAIDAVCDFFGKRNIAVQEINYRFLISFEAYLRAERIVKRKDQFGIERQKKLTPLSGTGLNAYFIALRTLFNAARATYNNEDKGDILITHYPFQKYQIKKAAPAKKRNLGLETIRAIRDFQDTAGGKPRANSSFNRVTLGRDVFMLIFYLLGINTADLYAVTGIQNGRLTYNRKKTKGASYNQALISIKIPDEALPLLEKYKDPTSKRLFNFYKHYKTHDYFSIAVAKGLKVVSEGLKLEKNVTGYYARHSFATIARNDCRCSKDDIAMSMNHSDGGHKVTDLYLAVSWDIVDEVQEKVLAALQEKEEAV